MPDEILIDDQLQSLTGMLALDIDKTIKPLSPWLSLPKKNFWPDEIGHIFEAVKYDRISKDGPQVWTPHTVADGTGNICNPASTTVTYNSERIPIQLESTAVKTLHFCVDDFRSKWRMTTQMEIVKELLAEEIKQIWIKKNRDDYVKIADNKVVLNSNLDKTDSSDGLAFAPAPATSKLTHAALDHFHAILDRRGAGLYAATQQNGSNIYHLISEVETIKALQKGDSAVRQDLRDSSKADTLLQYGGFQHSYNGYIYSEDPLPRRSSWDASGNQWIEHEPYNLDGTENDDYNNATHVDTIIFVERAYELLVPKVLNSIGPAKFIGPQSYIGEIQWVNILNEQSNIQGKNGFFYASLGNAVRRRRSDFAFVIRHLRCQPDLDLTGC